MSIKNILNDRVHEAMIAAGIDASCPPTLARSKQAKFGDFQANGAMAAAKQLKTNPRELAQKVLDELQLEGIASRCELAGPGFINIFLTDDFLGQQLSQANTLCEPAAAGSRESTVVVDYSAPNLAKEMHVGHLRSTIIGDVLARLLEFQGYSVIRQNHMGDWGTQFGMLIAELESVDDTDSMVLSDLETFYQRSKTHFDNDSEFAQRARDYVVRLQSGDPHCKALWQKFIDISVSHSVDIYQALGVTLTREHIMPESAYNDALEGVVQKLVNLGLAVDDKGAKVVFLEELADKNGRPSPVIVQKSGGGFLYSTTDIAALDHRCNTLGAKRLMYFIDARQSLHMRQLFALGRKAGIAGDDVSLEHHAFGTMMGKDGKPFKTRAGGTVKLSDLIDEALERAAALLSARESSLSPEEQKDVARKVAMGAVKYADLSKTRTNDYMFDWDGMLSFEGNTAPYLQYAYTRIRSVFRKAGIDSTDLSAFAIEHDKERDLALLILQFADVLDQVAAEAFPHILCTYLYELASAFMSFYEACPILKDDVSATERASRLALCQLSGDVLRCGLDLLGIEVMDYM
ncbi:MAG: arginine--tRNA ligase [Pseudomonadales bacterium]